MKNPISTSRLFFFFAVLFAAPAFSQGLVENELTSNPVLVQKYAELKSRLRAGSLYDTLALGTKGILDDFSKPGPYPDSSIWLDDKVFINRTWPKAPITLGVATFDGLDVTGLPYDFSASSGSSALADYFTSKPIHLDYPATDSVYLSFYYQPQGLGNAPEYLDSLVLQFKKPTGWVNVWAKKGTTLAATDSSWTRVMLAITDTNYLREGFQFRFYNRATLCGNTDHWHIDYVYLNRLRSAADTTFEDVSFVYETPALITPYSAMPWRQYDSTFMRTNYSDVIRNNHTVVKNASYEYRIFDVNGLQVNTTYSGGSTNINPFSSGGYPSYAPFVNPPLNYKIPSPQPAANRYSIECIVNSTPDNDRNNDTVRQVQDITNYYAYDDGTAENSYGMSVNGSQLAEQFTVNVADTLRYVDIYFNPFINNAALYTFDLKVWVDIAGAPGIAIYTSSSPQSPAYGGVLPNQFIRYQLDAPLYLTPGVFYVGMLQNTNQFLNVGVDKNNNTQSKVFYNIGSGWNNSPYTGSVMIHPVFGSAYEFSGISGVEKNSGISLYPNPSRDELHISFDDGKDHKFRYVITDVLGKEVMKASEYSDHVDVSSLKNGIYFITITDANGARVLKFIKAN